MDDAPFFLAAHEWEPLPAAAPAPWLAGWRFAKPLDLTNPVAAAVDAPVEGDLRRALGLEGSP